MSDELETLENEQSGDSGVNGLGDGLGDGPGIEFGTSADGGAAGSGNGDAIGDGSGSGSDGGTGGSDSGSGAADGVGINVAAGDVPGGSDGPDSAAGEQPRRKRGRPRKLGSRGSDNPDSSAGTGRSESGKKSIASDPIRVEQGEPKNVKAETLIDGIGKLPKSDVKAILAKALQGLFFVPGQILGDAHAKLWSLSDREAGELAAALLECLETFPVKQKKKVDAFLKEWGPWLKLAVVGSAIVLPRVQASAEISKLQKENDRLRNTYKVPANPGSEQWPSTIGEAGNVGGSDPYSAGFDA